MAEPDNKLRPFLFNVNNFDDVKVVPPPTFVESEMDAARRDAFEMGRKAGLAEAKAQREKLVADLIGAITAQFELLIAAEDKRSSQYEAETLFLSQTIFARLFPALNERHGLGEVANAIATVLAGQRTAPEVIIEVPPAYLDDIRGQIGQAISVGREGTCTVTAHADLAEGDCRLRWENGGAARSARRIAEQIGRVFQQMLADRAILRDNNTEIEANDAPVALKGHIASPATGG